jgi:hypothetical protein
MPINKKRINMSEQHTQAVDQRKIDRGPRRRLAPKVEHRLRVEADRPRRRVRHAENGGQNLEKAHGGEHMKRATGNSSVEGAAAR